MPRVGLHVRARQDEHQPSRVQDPAHRAPHEPHQEQGKDDRGLCFCHPSLSLSMSECIMCWVQNRDKTIVVLLSISFYLQLKPVLHDSILRIR